MQDAVVLHCRAGLGLGLEQLVSFAANDPSLPRHCTIRDCTDAATPQAVGQLANAGANHAKVMQLAVAGQRRVFAGVSMAALHEPLEFDSKLQR